MFFSASNLTGGYGGVNIIEECSFSVNRGEIVSILGPNGAGKSTAMKAMLGLLKLKSGSISIDGKDITIIPNGGGAYTRKIAGTEHEKILLGTPLTK
mgnify:CR=1 FL=1